MKMAPKEIVEWEPAKPVEPELSTSRLYWVLRSLLVVAEFSAVVVALYWFGTMLGDSGPDLDPVSKYGIVFGSITVLFLWGVAMTLESYTARDVRGLISILMLDSIAPIAVLLLTGGDWILSIVTAHIVLLFAAILAVVYALLAGRALTKDLQDDNGEYRAGWSKILLRSGVILLVAPVFIVCAAYVGALSSFLIEDLMRQNIYAAVAGIAGLIAVLARRFLEVSRGLKNTDFGTGLKVIRGGFNDFVVIMIVVTFMAAIGAFMLGSGVLFK